MGWRVEEILKKNGALSQLDELLDEEMFISDKIFYKNVRKLVVRKPTNLAIKEENKYIQIIIKDEK